MNKKGKYIKDVYFTPREIQCAELLTKDISVNNIAEKLGLSPRTITFYIHNMRRKIKCAKKTDLTRWLNEK